MKGIVIVFNWNHFETRLLNLRINFYLLRTLVLILVSEVAVNHLKKARGEIWPKRCDRRNNTHTHTQKKKTKKKKNFQDEDKSPQ